jgi:hypothetical protein
MTNPPNEFAQQLEELFRELHNVLQHNLANKVSAEDFNNLVGHIKNIEKRVKDTAQRMDQLEKTTQNLEEKFMRMRQTIDTMQQSAVRSTPSVPPQVVMPQQQVISQDPAPSNPNQFGNSIDEIRLSGETLAGRANEKNKQFTRPAFPVIETHQLLHTITDSQNYKESVQKTTVILVENTAKLMTNDDKSNVLLALQLCILIDLQNMHILEYKPADLYKSHTDILKAKSFNQPTQKFVTILEGYGLKQDIFQYDLDMLKTAIIDLANLQEHDIHQRIHGSYLHTTKPKEQQSLFQAFQNKIRQERNNMQSTETVSDPTLTQPSNQGS